MRRVVLLLFASLFASTARAQISTTPTNPVAGVPFVIHGSVFFCTGKISGATINGAKIDISVTPGGLCVPEVISSFDVTAGPLPAGTYTIRLLLANNNNSVIATAPLVVSADVPALDQRILAMLAMTLIVVATLRLRAR